MIVGSVALLFLPTPLTKIHASSYGSLSGTKPNIVLVLTDGSQMSLDDMN